MPKFAVVTGASSGIGAEFARQLSARGYNLMLVARRADRLQALSNSLTTECEIFTADLARKSECLRLADALADRHIDLFINNAGFGDCGPFLQTDLEKELQRTQLDLQCLQLQLSPHFFINTLNTIYFLSINEENLQLQSLTLDFMEYFRAVFKGSSSLIPLKKELEQCLRYISIQQVQKAQKPQVYFNIPDSLTDCMIPPLTILTFLENSIKYAHEQLKLLKLNVSAILQQEDASYYLILTIRDNGVGFPDSLLQDIENYTPPFSIGNEHIGLKNLLSRFYYFYDGNAFIHLCNPKTGGACAEVKIPIEL